MNPTDRKEQIAIDICGKPGEITMEECHRTFGRRNALCGDHKTCRIAEKSEEQTDYVLSSIQENTFLKACPGSGKTEVVGLKAAYEIKKWNHLPGGIAVLTFTRNAADVIAERVSQFVGMDKIGYPHFVGTIDSWLHGYIAHPFAHLCTGYQGKEGDRSIRIIEASSKAPFLSAFTTKYGLAGRGNPPANEYYCDAESKRWIFASGNRLVDEARNATTRENWQDRDLEETKAKFYRNGFATYSDIENLCLDLLEGNKALTTLLAKRFPLLTVDESQDLSWTQIQILRMLMRQGSRIHLVGDLDQAIWEFRKVDPLKVRTFATEHSFFEMPLAQNFRSCQPIVDICGGLVPKGKPVSSANATRLEHPCICVCCNKTRMAQLPKWFADYLDHIKIDKERSAIVTRGWSSVSHMRPAGSDKVENYQHRLAMAINLWRSGCRQATGDALKCVGRFLAEKYFPKAAADSRQHYRPECLDSPMRWRLFLGGVLKDCCEHTSIHDFTQTWKKWVNGVRQHFASIARGRLWMLEISDEKQRVLGFSDLDGNSFRVPPKEGDVAVESSLDSGHSGVGSSMRITTIHSVKGETLDALLLVSAPTKQGTTDGHWTQWLEDPTSEAARLAYVASSRPAHLLAWAVPNVTDDEKSRLQHLGFHFVDM